MARRFSQIFNGCALKGETAASVIAAVAAVIGVGMAVHSFEQSAKQFTTANSFSVRSDLEDRAFALIGQLYMATDQIDEQFWNRLEVVTLALDAAFVRVADLAESEGMLEEDWRTLRETLCPALRDVDFMMVSRMGIHLSRAEKICHGF